MMPKPKDMPLPVVKDGVWWVGELNTRVKASDDKEGKNDEAVHHLRAR